MFRPASIAVTAALCACALPALASETLNSRTDVLAALEAGYDVSVSTDLLSLIHISEPTRPY